MLLSGGLHQKVKEGPDSAPTCAGIQAAVSFGGGRPGFVHLVSPPCCGKKGSPFGAVPDATQSSSDSRSVCLLQAVLRAGLFSPLRSASVPPWVSLGPSVLLPSLGSPAPSEPPLVEKSLALKLPFRVRVKGDLVVGREEKGHVQEDAGGGMLEKPLQK